MDLRRTSVALAAAALAFGVGCGDNGSFILATNFGTVVGDPACSGNDGAFDFRNQEGLVLIVVVNDDTTIVLANGGSGSCRDLTAGADVEVRGSQQGGQIAARDVFLR